jgi:methyl-accepting chemotaxis protein
MFKLRLFRDTLASRLMVPVVIGGVLTTLLGAGYLITQSRRSIESQALQSARAIAYQVAQDRQQYSKQMESAGLDPMFIHEIGMSVNGQGLYRVNLLGMWPINPEHKARDEFETKALAQLLAKPNSEASRIHVVKGEPTLAYVRAENAAIQMCVDCHVSQLGEAKNQLAVGAPMGALVVEIPLGKTLAAANVDTARAVGLLALIMACVIFGLLWVIGRAVGRPVAQLLPLVEPLARGDFSRPVKVKAVAEIGRIAAAIEDTRSEVATVLGELAGTVSTVQVASSDVAQRAATLTSGSQEQAAALEETSASLQSMTDTVRTNSEHAQKAKQLAAHTRDQAEAGGEVVRAAVDAMSEITAASQRIGDISGTIDEIAFQINLLALNAAVEAARAGEQGRSFAVVASEVRTLAQRSKTASKEIKSVINDAVSQVERGNVLVGRSGETLTAIVGEVKQVADQVAGIAPLPPSRRRASSR